MPTQAYFEKHPPFPGDLPVAQLPRISFRKLLENDKSESDALFESSRALGFFLLDFNGSDEGEEFLKKTEKMFELGKEVYAVDTDELMKYAYKPPTSLFGYKHPGHLKIEDGRPDRIEFYNIGRDEILGVSEPLPNAACIEARRADLKDYMEQAHSIVLLICSHLDSQLHLAPGTLASFQPLDKPSGTHLRMLRSQPQPDEDRRTSLLGHTDNGSITILFNVIGGLQLLTPDADPKDESSWIWVKPQPGCAIVNLADAMVEWSGGILRSNVHRVMFAPGEQSHSTRYSLAYLVRPDGDAPMKRLAGGGSLIPELEEGEEDNLMNSRDWEVYKAAGAMAGRGYARSKGGRSLDLRVKKRIQV